MLPRAAAFLLLVTAAVSIAIPTRAAPDPYSVAAGPVHHVLQEDVDGVWHDCEEDGVATVTSLGTRVLVTNAGDQCTPGFSQITQCQGVGADGTFRCVRNTPSDQINITLTPDGVFDFFWDGSDFVETMHGQLARARAPL